MSSLRVDPGQIAAAGAAIEGEAGQLEAVASGLGALDAVADPPEAARALGELGNQWRWGMRRLSEDLGSLGQGVQAASTLYTETDRAAMGPG